MTDVQPSVSTEGRLRTMAFLRAIRRVPRARQVVMTAGRPAATVVNEWQSSTDGTLGLKVGDFPLVVQLILAQCSLTK